MKQLWLHIGMHKTGTTALQRFLCINAEAMSSFGYLYPNAGRDDQQEGHISCPTELSTRLRYCLHGKTCTAKRMNPSVRT